MTSHHKQARLEQIYEFIVGFSAKHLGNFPSVRQIGAACGISSTSLISGYLADLERAGRVVYIDGLACVAGARWLPPPTTYDASRELETSPSETAPDGHGNAQSKGVRPALPHGRAVDKVTAGAGWKRVSRAPVAGACPRCGLTLPIRVPANCENCGQALAVVGAVHLPRTAGAG